MAKKPIADELRGVFAACRGYFVTALTFSLAINILYLASPLYMLQTYDRVVSSGSEVTLVMLTVILLIALGALASLDSVRARVLARASLRLDKLLASRIVAATVEVSARGGVARSQPLRDFDNFRQFITGAGIHALFDMPWAPIYIAVIFLLHPLLGGFALCCAIILVGMAILNDYLTRGALSEANEAASRNYAFTDMGLRNSEVVQAMGMMPGLLRRWSRDRNRVLERQTTASERAATTSSLIRFLRLTMQSLILGLGAYLVIERVTTAGSMFAASILLGRALQPIEQVVGSWKALTSARNSFLRIRDLLAASPIRERGVNLPRPAGHLSVEGLSYVIPHTNRPILRNLSFNVEPGEVLGVIGPSGAGKSTLARHLVGNLWPSAGAVRLDGAEVASWPRESVGKYLGYLPQDIELFADSVANNISRFQSDRDPEIIEAAHLAGVHDMILRLSQGYETQIGEGGAVLSGGYRQRIGLARALFGNPSLVVLDEPSSNLDSDGDSALMHCLSELKRRGTAVVMISHRPNTLAAADKLLVLREGVAELFGLRDEVIARLSKSAKVQTMPAKATVA